MIKSSLCHDSDTYIHVKRTITIPSTETAAAPDKRNKKQSLEIVFHLLIV